MLTRTNRKHKKGNNKKKEEKKAQEVKKRKVLETFSNLSDKEKQKKLDFVIKNSFISHILKKSLDKFGFDVLNQDVVFYVEYLRLMGSDGG